MVSIAPAGALVSSLHSNMETGLRWIAVGVIVLCSFMGVIFLLCGKSLLYAINESMLTQKQQLLESDASIINETSTAGMGGGLKQRRSSASDTLLVARKKVMMVMAFVVITLVKVEGILMVGLLSKYGMAAPLVMFLAPLTLIPPVWNLVHIQVHSKRTKLQSEMPASRWQPNTTTRFQSTPISMPPKVYQVRVVPTLTSTASS